MEHTDYCTCFFEPEKNEVCFYDEITDIFIGTKPVQNEEEALFIMRAWVANAPSNIICQVL